MSTNYSFATYTGELQTTTSTYPIRLTFNGTTINPLVSNFSINNFPTLDSKIFIQGGPGKTIYSPAQRKIEGSFSIPVRVLENKELEAAISYFIDYTFFDQGSSCTPLAIRYFELETGFFKTASGYMVNPGVADYNFNSEYILIKFNRCIITKFAIEVSADSEMVLSISFSGTIQKDPYDLIITESSTISSYNDNFSINRILSLFDCKVLINNSYVPNCSSVNFSITRTLSEIRLSRSMNVYYTNRFPGIITGNPVTNYSNDFPSKIGVQSFEASITLKQILRKVDEDLYFSRGGVARSASYADDFIILYFGPIKVARTCAMAQHSEQPFNIGVVERSVTFSLLNKPKVIEEEYISVITGGLW